MDMTDEQLAESVKLGDDLAFQTLMRRYTSRILNFIRQYTRHTDEAEDIAQDTFFKAWRHIKKFKAGKSFKPWIFTIARNTAFDHLKKKRVHSFSELDSPEIEGSFADTLQDTEPIASDIFAHAESAALLATAMEILHPDHRAVLTMRYRDEMTFEEIAIVVDKPMNTVKSWHHRALEKLRKHLPHQKVHDPRI